MKKKYIWEIYNPNYLTERVFFKNNDVIIYWEKKWKECSLYVEHPVPIGGLNRFSITTVNEFIFASDKDKFEQTIYIPKYLPDNERREIRKVFKIFPWNLKDIGWKEFDKSLTIKGTFHQGWYRER